VEDQRLYLVIYYDNLHLKPFSRNRAGRELRRFLRANLQAGDRTMLVTFERNLHVRQAFTENLSLVERALQEAETLTGFAVQKEAERSQIIKRMDSSRGVGEAQAHIDLYARETHRDVESSIDGLKGVIASLSGISGRKALLYVSDGLPMEPAHDLYLMLDNKYRDSAQGLLQSSRYNVRGDFREVVAQANSNRVTFYTLQASGLRSHGSLSAESGGLQDGGSALDADLALESDLQEPLQMLAEGTGGQAVIGTNNLAGGLERLGEDLRTFYSLGFSPSHSGDGRYHRLEVQVKGRRGLTVRHRDGYRDKTPTDQLRDGTLASLLHGAGVNKLGLSVHLGQGQRRDDGFLLVPIEVRIPLGRVTLVPQDVSYLGRLQVSLAVAEDERGTSAPHIEPLTLSLPAGDLPMALEKYYVYAVELLMRPGQQLLAVGVRDELAGETSYLRQGVKVTG
jgi:VWFA-related protein